MKLGVTAKMRIGRRIAAARAAARAGRMDVASTFAPVVVFCSGDVDVETDDCEDWEAV